MLSFVKKHWKLFVLLLVPGGLLIWWFFVRTPFVDQRDV
jgi:hypothetical protein